MGKLLPIVLVVLIAALSEPTAADPGFAVQPTGQALGNTCQSYALGLGLAFKRDPQFRIETGAQLRATELAIRAEIKRAAGQNPINHEHIRLGFEAYTGGAYRLKYKDVNEAEVGDEAGQRSGVTSGAVVPASFLLGAVVRDILLTSANRIGNDGYAPGHIVAVLGKDGPPNSSQRMLILNSAVRIKNTQQNACTDGIPDDPGSYTATLSWKASSDISFKLFGGKARVWMIERS